jgi:tetratricopeptide (TPR) repeat protein
LGIAHGRTGRLQEAIREYEQALQITADDAMLHYNWGVALMRLARPQEGIGHWEQALRLKPDSADAQNALARLRSARWVVKSRLRGRDQTYGTQRTQ